MRYVALLRGIGPMNPNMRNAKLCGVLQTLGFSGVQAVTSTGNVVFDTDERDVAALEARIEAAWPAQLGFTSTTIIRTADQIRSLLDAEPFGDRVHSKETNLDVTFLKRPTAIGLDLPFTADDGRYTILAQRDQAVFSVTELTGSTTPPIMRQLERALGKDITTRTIRTLQQIGKRL